jgi:hypothetical protein
MPILKLLPKTEKKALTVKLASPVIDDLKAYAQFTNANINEVAQEALSYVFGKDIEFREWKEQQATKGPALQAEPVPVGKPAGKVSPSSSKPTQQSAPVQ